MTELTLPHPDAATTIFNLHDYRVLGPKSLSFGQRRINVESTVESGCPELRCDRHPPPFLALAAGSGYPGRWSGGSPLGQAAISSATNQLCPEEPSLRPPLQVPARSRSTRRLRDALVRAVITSGRAATETATAHGVSWWLVQKALTMAATKLLNVDLLRPRMLGIDEHRFRSVRFFKNTETNTWQRIEPWMTTIVDLDTGQILGVVDGTGPHRGRCVADQEAPGVATRRSSCCY